MSLQPLPIVRRCHRCLGDHPELYPTIQCYEILFLELYSYGLPMIAQIDPQAEAVYNRLVKEKNELIDRMFEEVSEHEKSHDSTRNG